MTPRMGGRRASRSFAGPSGYLLPTTFKHKFFGRLSVSRSKHFVPQLLGQWNSRRRDSRLRRHLPVRDPEEWKMSGGPFRHRSQPFGILSIRMHWLEREGERLLVLHREERAYFAL